MNRCARCGAQLRPTSKWCVVCGSEVRSATPPPPPPPHDQAFDETVHGGDEPEPWAPSEAKTLPGTIIEPDTIEEPEPADDFGNDTIAVPFPILPDPPNAAPTLQQENVVHAPVARAARRSTPVLAAAFAVLALLVTLGVSGYLLVTRLHRPAPVVSARPTPPPPPPAQPPVEKPAVVIATTETQGPPAPPPAAREVVPEPPLEPVRKVVAKPPRSPRKRAPAPVVEPPPSAEPEPVAPAPVDPNAVVEPGPGITNAKVLYTAPLRLPLRVRLRRIHGTATVEVIVNANGTPESPVIVESSGNDVFDRSALAAAMQCRFAAATRDGEPVRMRARVVYARE